MNREPRVRDLLRALIVAFVLAVLVTPALATQPACTGDRHYDDVANGCCPNVAECPTPEVCAPVLPCPDPAPCQPVTCKCEENTNVVEVDRCPQPEVSEVCKVRRNGTVVCPRSRAGKRGKPGPRKIYVPRSIVDQIADVERY